MRILITGAKGQLGQSLEHFLSKEQPRHEWLFAGHQELDITDPEAVEKTIADEAVDVIINCAAYTAVDQAESDPDAARRLNADAPQYLAQSAAAHGAVLIHISTDYVFSGEGRLSAPEAPQAYKETDRTDPSTVYGRTKLAGEEAVTNSGCRYLIFRTAWLYSPYGKNFVKTMLRLTAEKEALKVVDDQYGTPTNAMDLAAFLIRIVEESPAVTEGPLTRTGIYHYTNEGCCTWYRFAEEIATLAGHDRCCIHPCTTADYPTPAARPACSLLDKTKVRTTFGIELRDWKSALKEFIDNER